MRCIECLHHCEIIFCLAKNAIYNKRDICQWHFQILKRDKKDETMGIRNCCHLILIIIFRHMSFKVLKIWLPKPIFNSKNHLNFSETDFPLFFLVINVLWQLGFLKHYIIWNNMYLFYGNYFSNIRYFPKNMLILAWNRTNFCTSKKKLHNWH